MKTLLKDSHPELWQELDPNKNDKIDLEKVTTSNPKAVWWVCPEGHSYDKAPSERTRIRISKATGKPVKGAACPYCANKKVLTGYNDLATTNPVLAQEFHPTKNLPLTIHTIAGRSSKKVWWVCEQGHEWEASPFNRNRTKSGCGVCVNSTVMSGSDDLATTNPDVAAQWHPTKNHPLTPKMVTAGSAKRVWWVCEKGHEWENAICYRASLIRRNRNCPACANRTVLPGYNDLATTHPELIEQINLELNENLDIATLHKGSSTYVVWTCPQNANHTWRTRVSKRAVSGQGCPSCSNRNSKPEEEVYQYVLSLLDEGTVVRRHVRDMLAGGKELDIYIPEKQFAIEYNGFYWHSERRLGTTIHYKKWKELKEQDIQLFTVWEDYWLENKKLVKRMLSVKLGLGDPNGSVFARKTKVTEVSHKVAKAFLTVNHLQGHVNSTKFYGLVDATGLLVSLLGVKFNRDNHMMEISRFASAKHVVGGFSKLLSHALKEFPSTVEVLSYSDNSISNGNLYRATGFEEVNDNVRSYFYAVDQKRVHRSHYMKQRYRTDPDLLFQEGFTEAQLAELNNLDRVWDAGNTRWVKQV